MSNTVYPDHMRIILPDLYLLAIGKVCAQWGLLESVVERAIFKFADLPEGPRQHIVTAHMPWPLRMDILSSLVEELKSAYPHLERYKPTVQPVLRRAQDGRNRIVHAHWSYDSDTETVSILRAIARGQLRTSVTTTTVADIEVVADDIANAAGLLWKLILNK